MDKFFNMQRLPSRAEMIRHHEKRLDELIDRRVNLLRWQAAMQTRCAENGWPAELMREVEAFDAKILEIERQIERVEIELSELYHGEREGWPLRNEVYRSV